MGDPRRLKKKYSGPGHPWQKARIEAEAVLRKEYGYRSKKEVWKMQSVLRNMRAQARKLVGLRSQQAEKEKKQLLDRLYKLSLVKKDASLDDVLSLTIRDVLERRLQTILMHRKMATTLKQSRQFITHGHIKVESKTMSSPNYLVSKQEEEKIKYSETSPLSNTKHKIRQEQYEKEKKVKEIKKKQEKKAEPKKEIKKVEKK